jgi:hypothetical protein
MRRVVESSLVAHLWANQSQDEARNGKGSFYFDGTTIYSYGRHFPIAKHVQNRKGVKAVLFTSIHSTVTTEKHKTCARSAIARDVPVFYVPDVDAKNYTKAEWPGDNPNHIQMTKASHKQNLDAYQSGILENIRKAKRARVNGDWLLSQAQALVDEGNRYAAFFGLRRRFKIPTETDLQAIKAKAERERKRTDKQRKAREIENAKRLEARKAELAEIVEAWKKGEADSIPSDIWYLTDKTFLRVKGSRIQTSKGAVVDVESAKALLPLVRSGAFSQFTYGQVKIGDFNLDSVHEDGSVRIGCHTLERDEIERIAAELGL